MKKIIKIILGLPKTIWFNFRYLPIKYAYKLPIVLSNKVRIKKCYRGGVILSSETIIPGMIRIGFHEVDSIDTSIIHSVIDIRSNSSLIFKGTAHIGTGAILCCKGGQLTLGNEFSISGTTSIISYDSITIGNNVQFSWSSLVMDGDAHKIYNEHGNLMVNHKSIKIGNNVWIAASTTILKGSSIPNNCVIGSNSLLNRVYPNDGSIIAGIPAEEIKKISKWEL